MSSQLPEADFGAAGSNPPVAVGPSAEANRAAQPVAAPAGSRWSAKRTTWVAAIVIAASSIAAVAASAAMPAGYTGIGGETGPGGRFGGNPGAPGQFPGGGRHLRGPGIQGVAPDPNSGGVPGQFNQQGQPR